MELSLLHIDAFAEQPFTGNPAAVVFVPDFPDDAVMAAIAAEMNLSETAFVQAGAPGRYDLRWFTPTVEVDLCGHATLASGHAVLVERSRGQDAVAFDTRSGELVVRRVGDELELDLPAILPYPASPPDGLVAALGAEPLEILGIRDVHHAGYWLARYGSVAAIDALAPDGLALGALRCNVVVTAAGEGRVDFVSRFFAPASGVYEDPVTGSTHCTLAPMWAERLGKTELQAVQRSRRGGRLTCVVRGDRVALRGSCVTVVDGVLRL